MNVRGNRTSEVSGSDSTAVIQLWRNYFASTMEKGVKCSEGLINFCLLIPLSNELIIRFDVECVT